MGLVRAALAFLIGMFLVPIPIFIVAFILSLFLVKVLGLTMFAAAGALGFAFILYIVLGVLFLLFAFKHWKLLAIGYAVSLALFALNLVGGIVDLAVLISQFGG